MLRIQVTSTITLFPVLFMFIDAGQSGNLIPTLKSPCLASFAGLGIKQ